MLSRDPGEIAAALFGGGYKLGLQNSTLRLIGSDTVELSVSAYVDLSNERMQLFIWMTEGKNLPVSGYIQLISDDGFGARVIIFGQVIELVSGLDKTLIEISIHSIRAKSAVGLLAREKRALVSCSLPPKLAYPFTALRKTTVSMGDRFIDSHQRYAGFWGSGEDLELYIEEGNLFDMALVAIPSGAGGIQNWDAAEEALEYVIGIPLTPFITSIEASGYRETIIRPVVNRSSSNNFYLGVDRLNSEGFFETFSRYFKYALTYGGDRRTRLHGIIHDVYGSLLTYETVQVLHLCIAIESLARGVSDHPFSGKFSSSEVESFHSAISELDLPNQKLERLRGIFSRLDEPSVPQMLSRMIELKVLSPVHKKTWSTRRHKSAHGAEVNERRMDMVAARDILLDAFHKLVHWHIETNTDVKS